MVFDVVLEMVVFVLRELLLEVGFHSFLHLWILLLYALIMISLCARMVAIKTREICVRHLVSEPILLWWEGLLLDVIRVQELLLTRMEGLLRCIEEWLDVQIYHYYLVGANIAKAEKTGAQNLNPQTFSAEGVEGYIPFTGPLKFVIQGYANGIRSGMSYTGAYNLA